MIVSMLNINSYVLWLVAVSSSPQAGPPIISIAGIDAAIVVVVILLEIAIVVVVVAVVSGGGHASVVVTVPAIETIATAARW